MRHVLFAFLVSLPAPPLLACPGSAFTLRDLMAQADHMVTGEVIELHEAAGTQVAEVLVSRILKGAPPARFFYPADSGSPTPDGPLKVGSRVLLFLVGSDDYSGTRSFWKELDRLRAGEAFLDLAFMGQLRFSDDRDALRPCLLRASRDGSRHGPRHGW